MKGLCKEQLDKIYPDLPQEGRENRFSKSI
jgi:hypothetical protein